VKFRLLACAIVLWVFGAEGRVQETCPYTRAQLFQSALRFIRVDSGFTLTEKDEASGYLLFEYPTGQNNETTPGSFEIIEHDSSVQLIVRIPKLAEHHERLLVKQLFDKLRSEYGEPPPKKSTPHKKPKKAAPDKDKDDSNGEDDDDGAEEGDKPEGPDDRSHNDRSTTSR
jgi:hypothetical protein